MDCFITMLVHFHLNSINFNKKCKVNIILKYFSPYLNKIIFHNLKKNEILFICFKILIISLFLILA